jgi:adhesin transport system outer membrane protein
MNINNKRRWALIVPSVIALTAGMGSAASAVELRDAVQVAVDSNPQISTAIQDKEAIEFERRQAQGLYLPRFNLEAGAGVRHLDNPTRRALNIERKPLYPVDIGVTGEQVLFDSGARRAELRRQAARTDGAATRVQERSEFIALEVVREYLNYMLQQRLVAIASDNIAFHRQMVSDLSQGVTQGSISVADQQQAEERLQASKARLTQAQEDLVDAGIAFETRTGLPLDATVLPPPIADKLPPSVNDAIGQARTNNPRVRIAMADIDAAHQVVRAAKADWGPRISIEAGARTGQDIDGLDDRTSDLQARLVIRWKIYDGGIRGANIQEQVRRASEERFKLHQVVREVEEDVQSAWNRRTQQAALLVDLSEQSRVSGDLVNSYREQFRVGRRSLLDVLDAQNTSYNAQVLAETARFAELFAEYKVLAATGNILEAMGIQRPVQSAADARQRFDVPATPPAELMERRHVSK